MSERVLFIGNKNYSSWSLRAWLAMTWSGVPFREQVIFLDQGDSTQRLRGRSPSGRVPVLHDGALVVWDSVAIAEYAAELAPHAKLWPEDRAARAVARSVSAEMHAGFAHLRQHMPMNVRARHPGMGRTIGVLADLDRIFAMWKDCRARFGAGGPFLFGARSIADAMFAPVVFRLRTYDVPEDEAIRAYTDAVLALPEMRAWEEGAREETQAIAHEDYPARS